MSLILPEIYNVENINENWIVQFTEDNSNAFDFDGVDDYISFGDIMGTYTSFTLEAWIYLDSTASKPLFSLGQYDGTSGESATTNTVFALSIQNVGDLKVNWEYGDGVSESEFDEDYSLSTGQWFHVCVTRDNADNKIRFYKDGQLTSTSGATNDPTDGDSTTIRFLIGRNQNFSSGSFFNGKMRNVRIWNIARTNSQIASFFNKTISSSETGLVGYWKLDEGSGTTIYDSTSNNNNGTVSNANNSQVWSNDAFNEFIYTFGLSFKDTTISNNFYYGVILNKGIKIRESINLADSSAKTSGINLNIANFLLNNNEFYKEIINGTRNYINKDVRIFSQPHNANDISNCLQIYHGRLTDVSLDQHGVTSLQLSSRTPWDFISIPNQKSTTNNVYFPVVYGNYTPETSTDSSPQFCDDAVSIGSDYSGAIVHPTPQDLIVGGNIKFLPHLDTETNGTDSDSRLHYYEPNYDIFVPLDPPDDTADSYGGGGAVNAPSNLLREFKTKDYDINSSTTFSSSDNIKNNTLYSTATLQVTNRSDWAGGSSGGGTLADDEYIYLDFKKPDGRVTNLNITFDYILDRGAIALSGSPTTKYVKIIDDSVGNDDDLVSLTISSSHTDPSTGSVNANLANPNAIDQIALHFKMRLSDTNNTNNSAIYDVSIRNVVLTIKCQLDTTGEPDAVAKRLLDTKKLYSGSDGHNKSYIGGSGSVITNGLEAHRDLLARFAGYDADDSNITNWSSGLNISSLRNAWNIRYWNLEPKLLKKILLQIQKEFAFIFKWRADGTGSYWAVKDSYSSSDVVVTLKKEDIKNIKIQSTPFNELLTNMTINYNYHPAKESFLSSLQSEDTTNNVRQKYNIRDKENIQQVDLEMNVDKAGNADVGHASSNTNDGYSDYYMNIFGDIKKIISCEIVNPSKGYKVESGDVIQFSNVSGNMPINPFGSNWTDYYMITDVSRGIGSVNIKCRQVN